MSLNLSNHDLVSVEIVEGVLKTLKSNGVIDEHPLNGAVELNLSINQLKELPELPDSLLTLTCGGNQLQTLPKLPKSLIWLSCHNNLLQSLPKLPNSLLGIYCYGNHLSTLPKLPKTLERLYCSENDILKLPKLPKTLNILSCHKNRLETLPTLPKSLSVLRCTNNHLQTLPNLPSTITNLSCFNNPLVFIPPLPKRPERYQAPNLFIVSHSEENYETYYKRYQTYKYLISFLAIQSNLMPLLLTNKHFWFPGEGEDWEEKLFEGGGFEGWKD